MVRYKKIEHDVAGLFPKLRDELEKDGSVLFVYIFGSYGRGTVGPLSDVDIAVFLDERLDDFWPKRLELIEKTTRTLRTDEVDLIVLNEAPLLLRYQVIKTGRLLFSNDEERRIDFEAKTIDFYLDTEPLRKLAWQTIVRRVKEGTYGHQ